MEVPFARIEAELARLLPEIRRIRRHLHSHPELSLCERETARLIRSELEAAGVQTLPPFLETDVVGLLRGNGGGRNVTLRADTDALPLQEEGERGHRSRVPGVMHACGHDGHTAMLLGAARLLALFRENWAGSVRFVFQPGEEIVAAGRRLVAAGALEEPRPDALLALHAWAGRPVGVIGSRPGVMMAAADIFTITIRGKGGHGSRPERTVDPILIATRVIDALYAIPSRRIGALEPVVISVCSIHGGSNANVIPDEVVLQGSARYLTRESGERLPSLFELAIEKECRAAGADWKLEYQRPYIPTVNDGRVVAVCREVAQGFLGSDSWVDMDQPSMGAEDFSHYIDGRPGGMFFIGMGEESPQLHSSGFDFNDDALRNGILFLVLSTLELLRG